MALDIDQPNNQILPNDTNGSIVLNPKAVGSGIVSVDGDLEADNLSATSLTEDAVVIADSGGQLQSTGVTIASAAGHFPMKLPVLTSLPGSPQTGEYGLLLTDGQLQLWRYMSGGSWQMVNGDTQRLAQRDSDPANPGNGESVIWQSDGTSSGDDGDILMKITDSSGTTKTTTLVDFSAI